MVAENERIEEENRVRSRLEKTKRNAKKNLREKVNPSFLEHKSLRFIQLKKESIVKALLEIPTVQDVQRFQKRFIVDGKKVLN